MLYDKNGGIVWSKILKWPSSDIPYPVISCTLQKNHANGDKGSYAAGILDNISNVIVLNKGDGSLFKVFFVTGSTTTTRRISRKCTYLDGGWLLFGMSNDKNGW